MRRGCGWTKAFSQTPYNNQDFHDQLLLFGGTVREPVTGLFEFQSARGIRSFWLTTQSRIAKLNETTGNWKIIASGLGGGAGTDCSGPRFKAANVGDYVIFTNGHDRPKVHRLEQPPFDDVLIADLPDLELIGLTKAALAFAWKDIVILADVEMDGERHPNRFVWSNLKDPQGFDPGNPASITGQDEFNYGERILAGGPTTAGTFLMYTTEGIWELSTVGDSRVFVKREAYPGRKADFTGCLKYQNTLVDIGGDHIYMAKDGIYAFNPYRSAPELILWLHRASSVLFDDIDDSACAASIGWFHDSEAFFSVKRNSDVGCPGITLRIETQFKVADVIDRGFTAAANYRPQPIQTIRDFILDKRICDLSGLTESLLSEDLPPPFENEGLPSPLAEPTAAFVPQQFYTENYQIIGDVVTEDWNKATADADSLCALLGDTTLDDLCINCESVSVLIAASSRDWCLKQFGGFYRERCANPTATGNLEQTVNLLDSGVDFAFVVDESASLPTVRAILTSLSLTLEANLRAAHVGAGSVPNRYSVVAFGYGAAAETQVDWTDSATFAAAMPTLGPTHGGGLEEDAYEGIDFAINNLAWRDSDRVTKLIFFITDEDRNVWLYTNGVGQAGHFASLKAQLVSGGFLLAGMTRDAAAGMKDASSNLIIACDSTVNLVTEGDGSQTSATGKSYRSDGAGGFTESAGVDTVSAAWVSDSPGKPDGAQTEYFDLLMDKQIAGYWFNYSRYESGGPVAASVLGIIVPVLSERIRLELNTELYTSAVGSYILDGYDSIIRFAPLSQEGAQVIVERFGLKGIPAVQAEPRDIELRCGVSGQTADSNDDHCPIVWLELTPKQLRCVTDRTAAQHTAAKTVPAQDISWRFHRVGKVVHLELKITGTGGDCVLSGVVASAKATPARNF